MTTARGMKATVTLSRPERDRMGVAFTHQKATYRAVVIWCCDHRHTHQRASPSYHAPQIQKLKGEGSMENNVNW
ncbi:hypothetical protein Taro_039102 [Colocasia esculenta]|uniref:Uncharacterized protein n=1 Tax=Colocasia esculenta TaxID=4460 RepID=A0A843WL73_COLES|nr:hypothetical protein [Colocasia esculenta]